MYNKVLILANSSNGLYNFRKELISELKKESKVIVAIPDDNKVADLQELGCYVINTPMKRRGINPLEDLEILIRYLQLLRKERPDIVITYTIKPNVYGGFASRVLQIPYAVNITGLGTAFQNQGLLHKLVTLMYKVSMKKAKVVFFENAENQQIFINQKIVEEKNTCLLNGAGVNLEHFIPAQYPENNKPVRFLYVGRVMKEKGIDVIYKYGVAFSRKNVEITCE